MGANWGQNRCKLVANKGKIDAKRDKMMPNKGKIRPKGCKIRCEQVQNRGKMSAKQMQIRYKMSANKPNAGSSFLNQINHSASSSLHLVYLSLICPYLHLLCIYLHPFCAHFASSCRQVKKILMVYQANMNFKQNLSSHIQSKKTLLQIAPILRN